MKDLTLAWILALIFCLYWNTCLAESKKNLRAWQMETKDVACLTEPCPDPKSTDWKRLQKICCPHGGHFHCQANDLGITQRLCMKPVVCPAGYFANLMTIQWTFTIESLCQRCPLMQFQPAATPSHYFTRNRCDKNHTDCPSPHTMAVQLPNATSDYLCKCFSWTGYRPVPMANHDCKVFASSSDCKCRLDPCPDGQVLNSTDYTCIVLTLGTFEDLKKEASADMSNLKLIKQQLQNWLEQVKEAEHHHWETFFSPFGEVICCVDDRKNRPPMVFLPSSFPLLRPQYVDDRFGHISETNGDIFTYTPESFVFPLAGLTGLLLFLVLIEKIEKIVRKRKEKRIEEPHTYIRLYVTKKKAVGIAKREIQNILPFLKRHYGPLVVSVNPKKRHITIVVRQGRGNVPFPLRAFLRDILRTLSMKDIKSCENQTDSPAKVFVLTGMTADLKEIEHKFSNARFQKDMTHNKGEMTLLLPEKKTEATLLRKLRWAQSSLKDMFLKYHLHLDAVQEGSIRFKLRLASCPETLDELAHDQRIIQITQDLFSHESFRELACGQNLPVQFTCSVKMENVSVLTANNLYVQIGRHNRVNVVASPGHRTDGGDDEEGNEESYIIMADDSVDVTATIESAVAFQVIPRKNRPQEQAPDNGGPATTLKKNQVKIVVKCEDERLASRLETEWLNILRLLENHHPGWRMTRYRKKILWDRTAREKVARDQLLSFLCDILSPQRVQHLTDNHSPHIDVYVGEELRHAIDKPQQVQQVQQVQTRRTCVCQSLRTAITRHFYKIPLNVLFIYLVYKFVSMLGEEPEQSHFTVTLKPTAEQYTWFFLPYIYNDF